MARMGALGIGLSLIFGGFVLVLLAELYYVFFWKRRGPWNTRINSVAAECIERADARRGAGGLMSYSRSVADAEFVAKLFPIRSEVAGSNSNLYMQGVFGGPRLLFTIKEETTEDMEYEESVASWEKKNSSNHGKKNNKKKKKLYSESSPPPVLQQPTQRQFAYSIGLIQQHLAQKMCAESPSPKQQSVHSNPFENSCPFPNGRFPCSPPLLPAFISPPSWRSSSSSSSLASSMSPPWRKSESQCAEQDSNPSSANSSERNFVCISNPVYEVCSQRCQDCVGGSTPFGTPVSSPSLLDHHCETPPLSPPLTPMKAPPAARSLPLGQFSGDSGLSSKYSSPYL